MKKTLCAALLLTLTGGIGAQPRTIQIVPANGRITFTIGHLLSSVDGSFHDFSGQLRYDPSKPADGSIRWDVKVASVDTQNAARDHHLGTADYFDSARYPTMSFASDSVKAVDATHLSISGKFTLRGVTRPLTIPVELSNEGFNTDFIILRSQYRLYGR